jgi:hypothetical protein
MDVSTVSNAVNSGLSGLPAGTSDFINANIGTPAGQQAILQAGLSLGLSQAQIASAVSQATGMTVTPQQVAQVAQSIAAPAPTPAPANISAPAPVSAPTGTSLSNIPQFVGSAASGSVGTNYGQASGQQIASVQQNAPDFATALQNGTAKMTYDGEGVPYLYDAKTGQQIPGNYQIQTGANGQIGINVPAVNGSMIQIATKMNQDGSIPPVSASNVLNVGLNAGAGGFAGGISDIKPLLTQAALMYAGSALGDYLNAPTADTGTTLSNIDTGVNSGGIGNTGNLGSTDYSLGGAGSSGTGLNVGQGAGTQLFDTSAVNPATGLTNGLGLQASGSSNLASMGGGQGLTIPTSTGTSAVNNAVLGAGGTNNYGTNNLGGTTGTTGSTGTTNTTGTTGTTGLTTGGSTGANTLGTTLAGVNTGINSGAVTGGGTTGLLTPTNALIGSSVLNTLGSLGTNNAIANAANTQAQAGQKVQDVLGGFYNQYAGAQQPYQNLGSGAVQQITDQAPYLTHQFNAQDLQAGLAPNYDFMLQQGQGANRNLANVGGGLLSGNTLQGLNQFTQNYAGNAYQNAFNNYQTQRQNIYGNLSNAAGIGQTSLGNLGTVGSSLASTYGNVTTGLAASQAGAQTAQAVNTQNTLSNLGTTAL